MDKITATWAGGSKIGEGGNPMWMNAETLASVPGDNISLYSYITLLAAYTDSTLQLTKFNNSFHLAHKANLVSTRDESVLIKMAWQLTWYVSRSTSPSRALRNTNQLQHLSSSISWWREPEIQGSWFWKQRRICPETVCLDRTTSQTVLPNWRYQPFRRVGAVMIDSDD